jgi:hypothetical protein
MGRPRKAADPLGYKNAADVLPAGLLKSAVVVLDKTRGCAHRVLTFSKDRHTTARRLLGEHIYLGICAVMEAKDHGTSWRLYFPRDLNPPDYSDAYAMAARLMQRGYSRRVAAIVAGVSIVSLKRRVDVAYSETQSLTPVTSDEITDGYRFIATESNDADAASSTLLCGLVGRALKEFVDDAS